MSTGGDPGRVIVTRSAGGMHARITTPPGSTCGPSTLNGSAWRASASAWSIASRLIRTPSPSRRAPAARRLQLRTARAARAGRASADRRRRRGSASRRGALRPDDPPGRRSKRRRSRDTRGTTRSRPDSMSAAPAIRTGHRAGRGARPAASHTAAPAVVLSTRSKSPTFWTSRRSNTAACESMSTSTSAPVSESLSGSTSGGPPRPRSIVGVRRFPPLSAIARWRASRSSSMFTYRCGTPSLRRCRSERRVSSHQSAP